MSDPRIDAAHLREHAYADSTHLSSRVSLYDYRDDDVDLIPWVLEQVDWPAVGPVLDVGCGPGRYLVALTATDEPRVAADLSFGMVVEAVTAADVPGVQADVGHLPVRTGAVGRVLAPHMLYHAARPSEAVAELRRTISPGGDLVVVLNGAGHLAELRAATELAAGAELGWERLLLEEAVPLLEAHFDEVEVHRRDSRLLITEPEPVAAYVASSEALHGDQASRPWSAVVKSVGDWAAGEIDRAGHVEIRMRSGALVAR